MSRVSHRWEIGTWLSLPLKPPLGPCVSRGIVFQKIFILFVYIPTETPEISCQKVVPRGLRRRKTKAKGLRGPGEQGKGLQHLPTPRVT